MLSVYIFDGQYKGKAGYLLQVDGRTAEVATRNQILRIDVSLLTPLDIAHNFDEIDSMVKQATIEKPQEQ